MKNRVFLIVISFLTLFCIHVNGQGGHKNFKTAVYCPARDVDRMSDLNWLEKNYALLDRYLDIDKVYLETYRGEFTIEKEKILKVKKFFEDHGVKTAGGITYEHGGDVGYVSFCITDPEHRKKIREIAEYTASMFDEVILDDFWFINTKCESSIEAKGDKSWTQFRLDEMEKASKELIIDPAKKINPKVKVIVKFPNWYDHFQTCGFNLDKEPKLFDGIYTGTETRDPVYTDQHLQPYESYAIIRYFENIAPGRNGGGWVDPYSRTTLDRYAEQLNLTLFAKAKEITLFCFSSLLEEIPNADGSLTSFSPVAPVAGYSLDKADMFLNKLGNPVGIKTYKPYNSSGEDFLPNYMGMLGIPMDITPDFPYDENLIFLTAQAAFDKDIIAKIKGQLKKGKDVVITSGLYRVLQGKGIEDVLEIEYTDKKALVRQFSDFRDVYPSENTITIPQIRYNTNDSWELLTGLDSGVGYPILLRSGYGSGMLYVLTIPDNMGELDEYPEEILTGIKKFMMKNFFVTTESASDISLFVYDNNTFIVQSFKEHNSIVKIVLDGKFNTLVDMLSNRSITGYKKDGKTVFESYMMPHSYRVFRAE
jgi:hypothetical protein